MKRVLLMFSFIVFYTASWAQKENDFKKNAIDIGTGATMSYVNLFEHDGQKAFSAGINFSLRYTRFFDRHWGAFIQGDASSNSASRNAYFGKVRSLDGNLYTYNWFKTGSTTQGSSHIGIFAGTVYRFDAGRWSFRPRIGIGASGYGLNRSNYYRTPSISSSTDRQAVLILPSEDENKRSFTRTLAAGKIGMQFKYSITDHFYLGADIDLTVFMARHEYIARIYETKKKEQDLGSVIAGLLTLGLMEDYERTDLVSETKTNALLPPIASISFSLGWDF